MKEILSFVSTISSTLLNINNQKTSFFRSRFVFVFLMILASTTSLFAFDFDPSTDIQPLTINKADKTLSFKILVYNELGGSNDDNLLYAEVRINGVNYFDIVCKEYTGYGSGIQNAQQVVSLYGQNEDTWGINKYSAQGSYTISSTIVGDFAYLDITFPIPSAYLYETSYALSFSRLKFEDAGADYDSPYSVPGAATGWPAITTSNFIASNNSCSSVNIGWQIPTGDVSDIYIKLNEGYNVLSSGQNLYSFTQQLGSTGSTASKNYSLTVGYGPNFKNSVTKYTTGGPPNTGYGLPATVTVSNHSCGDITLNWDNSGFPNTNSYLITNLYNNVTYTVGKSQDSFTIPDLHAPQNYTFRIQGVNECGFKSAGTTVTSYYEALTVATGLTVSETSSGALKLDWIDGFAESSYKIIKTFSGGATETFDLLPKNSTSYIDNNVNACVNYTYRLFSVNKCQPNGLVGQQVAYKIIPGLTNTFSSNNFRISKGYYSNRVELEWTPDNNGVVLQNYIISRKILGSSAPHSQITSQSASTNFFVDNLTDAGILYEYKIFATLICDGVVEYTDTATAIGFRSSFGTVTGQINYAGGIAVEDVRVEAQSSSGVQGVSLAFSGNDSLRIENSSSLATTDALTIEMWIEPSTHATNFTLVEKKQSFSVKHIGSNYVFEVFTSPTSSQTVAVSDAGILLNNFNQLSAVLYNDSLRLYVNGVSTNYTLLGDSIHATTNPLIIASGFQGLLDEFRFWNKGKDKKTISQDFSRVLSGSESGLKVYLKINEGASNFAYDFSHAGVSFNKNHAKLMGTPTWSADVPTSAQLAITSYTNAQGNYIMVIPYSGIGETFTLSPSYLIHQFNPSTRAIFIGEGASVHNNIDFTDISSFTVQGSLFYENTSCAVAGATLKVDGQAVIFNGLPAQTDAAGAFNIKVPIGNHFITIEKDGHTMSIGRFPAVGTFDFQADLAGINFKDSTLVKITGRVVGGLREAQYEPGFGKSKNNIGQAQIILTSQQGNGCFTDTVLTDMLTGEYTTYAPPMKYIPSVKIPSNLTINFGVLNLLDYSGTPPKIMAYDTLSYDSLTQIYTLDSLSYNYKLDYIQRVDPEIIIVDYKEPTKPFIGEREYSYLNFDGSTISRDLSVNPFPWPLLDGRTDKDYKMYIQVMELYTNLATGVVDSVPNVDASLSIINNLSNDASLSSVATSKFNTINRLDYLLYSFQVGTPSFQENASIPEYSFTKTMEIYLTKSNGAVIQWKPNTFNGTPSGQFLTVYDGTFRAYVLGQQSTGQQYITAGPQVPDYVLRDPPGSESSASREIGTEKSNENSWSWNTSSNVESEDKVLVGAKFAVGLGISIATEVKSNFAVGLSASVTGGNSGTESVTVTNTEEWSTNANAELPGKNSDLYVGKSKNVSFGITEILKIVPDSLCAQFECLGNAFDGFSFAKTKNLAIVPDGYETQFLYSENHIKNYLIPELENLRNALLQSNPKYSSNLPVGDENYGKNNDDPDLVDSLNVSAEKLTGYLLNLPDSSYNLIDTIPGTPIIYNTNKILLASKNQDQLWKRLKKLSNPDYSVLTGLSYTYNAVTKQDSLSGDSVRWINNQIQQWENAIMLNEWEKVNIDNVNFKTILKEKALSDLRQKYDSQIKGYIALTALSSIATAVVAVSAAVPLPFTTYVGAAAFAVATGTGIAAAELNEEYLRYLNLKTQINSKFNQSYNNYSISAGNNLTSSITHETASTYKKEIEYGVSTSLAFELEGTVSNTGAGYSKGVSLEFTSGREWAKTTTASETVSFTLSDPDQGDYFSVDVYPSFLGWGPIFKLRPGGQTSCPHEDVALTEYYIEDPANLNSNNPYSPSFILSERTKQREKASINAAPSILTNIPISDAAVFNLTIDNISESGDGMAYKVELVTTSNPFGAIVKIDGIQPFTDVTIPGGTSINKVITVEKGAGPVYNYDSLLIIVHSKCQYEAASSDAVDIVDSTYISAHFLPTCTDINFATPDNMWVLNNSFRDTLPVGILDYNINFFDFESIKLQYKPSSQAQWIGLKTFYKDTTGLSNETPIPVNTPFTLWDWETDQIVDGEYDLRLITQCVLANKTSVTHSGIVDRINPHPFGTPSPADGILDPNDDIKIKFNEPVDIGSITSLNFDIRGVLNGSETNHFSNLYFDGVDDYVEVTAGIPVQSRDFTIEFSVKRVGTGQEVILSQGANLNEQIYVGFNSADQLEFKINDQVVTSNVSYTDNDWHNFAVSYNYNNETAQMFEASGTTTAALINSGNTAIYSKYLGSNQLYIGKSVANSSFFNGNIDDVRIWNTARTLSEFSINKSILLGSNQLGLLYNWRFDEADGLFAKDHVRQRNGIINGAEWTIEPSGSAVSFDGVDDYLRINKDDVNITKEMDFTLEFWFNSSQTTAATLVSNGSGTGLAADSLYSWNIAKDNTGKIHVYHNGNDFVAVNNNYFDGEWHHFALVLNRVGNISAYVDGNLQNAIQALPFKDFGGSALYLGARGYYVGSVETFDSYFDGSIDEFRFWNTSRKAEQILRDKQNRMKGDEFALNLYLPFENYQLDPTGIALLTPSFDEQINAVNHVVTNPNGAALITTAPKIKLQRPVQSIAFTYSVNGDEIIMTPTTNEALIENVTLDITVKGIKDKHGNVMQSPKTWIAYMNKNQVGWQDDLLSFNKDFGTGLNFSSAVVNSGGAQKAFTISNVPSWLSVSPMSGIVSPNSTLPVAFTIDPNVNIGNYIEDIHLTTDFGYPEKLTIDLKVRTPEPQWTVNPANYTNSMSIIGYVAINDVVSTSAEDILAVFVNDTCRGSAHLQYVPLLDRYLVFLDVYSNLNNGENLDFKVWDASAGTVFSQILPANLSFVANGLIGSTSAPQLFETSYEIEVAIPLNVGWNWVSHFLLNSDSTNLDLTLESLESVTGNEIKGLTSFSNYLNNTGWVGSLNATGIRPEEGYKLKVSQIDTLVIKGDIINPISRTINLAQGWNWIGFISIRNQTVSQALGNLNPSNGDIIKAQSQFAVYDNLLGWVGSLQTMKPGTAYMYYTTSANSFVFPSIGQFKFGIADNNEIYKNKKWSVINNEYASNMTIISSLETDCDYILESKDLVIGVFDESANCRAVNEVKLLDNKMYSFLTVGGANSTKLKFGIMDTKTGRNYDLTEEATYNSNERLGTVKEPFKLKISDDICFKMQFEKTSETEGEIALENKENKESMQVYPSLFEDEINLYYLSKTEGDISRVRLFNLWGQLVYENVYTEQKGFNKVSFDLFKTQLTTGVYHFIVEDKNAEMHSFKIIKK